MQETYMCRWSGQSCPVSMSWRIATLNPKDWKFRICGGTQTLDNKIKEFEVERHALFFTDADAKRIYKENVKFTVLRKNSVNGRVYKDDPTIFSWGLLNEPRCETWKVCSCVKKTR